jgi:hypothetical protein
VGFFAAWLGLSPWASLGASRGGLGSPCDTDGWTTCEGCTAQYRKCNGVNHSKICKSVFETDGKTPVPECLATGCTQRHEEVSCEPN